MHRYLMRIAKTLFGSFLFGIGAYLTVQANVGLSPWAAFYVGFTIVFDISYGAASAITGLFFLAIVLIMREKVGIGTFFDAVLIGLFVDLFKWINIMPTLDNMVLGVIALMLGQTFISIATYFYISPGLGAGPRDTLMVILGRRFPKLPIGLVRGLMEGSALLIGWLLGAKVGVGTVLSVFCISFVMQATFGLLRFDVKKVVHEDIVTSIKNMWALSRGRELPAAAAECAVNAGAAIDSDEPPL